MDTPRDCRRCGAPLPPGAESCPRCLLGLGIAPPAADPEGADDVVITRANAARPTLPTREELVAAFPDLEIHDLIGRGGMGAVFRARQTRLERDVALKVMPRELSADPSFAERFLREARALARLSHPNIVAVHDFGETGGLCWLLMEFVDGANLRDVLRKGRIEPRQSLTIVRELCEALQFAHDEGVVHRDIKPENVLIDRKGRVKVTDFGLAKLIGPTEDAHLTRDDQVMGTPHYMAPEQIERPRDVDHRADIYALGVVLYEMLTGSLPRGKFDPPSRRVEVDVRLDRIVLRALEHEPARRYQHAVDVKTDVEDVEQGPRPEADGARAERAGAKSASSDPQVRVYGLAVDVRDPLRGGLGIVIALMMWIAVAALWNVGAFGLGLGFAVLIALFGHLLQRGVDAQPHLKAALREFPAGQVALRRVQTGVLLALAGLALVLLHASAWEHGTTHWAPAYRDGQAVLHSWRSNPLELLASIGVTVPSDGRPAVHMLRSFTLGDPAALLAVPLIAWLAVAVLLILAAGFVRVRVPGRKDLRRPVWLAVLRAAFAMLLGLFLSWGVSALISSARGIQLESVSEAASTSLPLDEAADATYAFLIEKGLQVDTDQTLEVIDARTRVKYAGLRLFRGASASPIARWSIQHDGVHRATPSVWVRLSRADDERTVLWSQAGLATPGAPEAREWQEMLAELAQRLAAAEKN